MKLFLFVVLQLEGLFTQSKGCMTWEIRGDILSFNCTVPTFSQTISLLDNLGKVHLECNFQNNLTCSNMHHCFTASIDMSLKKIRFALCNIKSNYVDGIWKCRQGNTTFISQVSKEKGIIKDTHVNLKGSVSKTKNALVITLRCYTCRNPRGNHVEFLINNRSEDVIVFNQNTGRCSHHMGECHPDVCSCAVTGNEFNLTLYNHYQDNTLYSCEMQFIDEQFASIFAERANQRLKGEEFEEMNVTTRIIKAPYREAITSVNGTENITTTFVPPGKQGNEGESKLKRVFVAVFSTIIAIISVSLIVCLLHHTKNAKKKKYWNADDIKTAALLQPGERKKYVNATTMTETNEKEQEKHLLLEMTETNENEEEDLFLQEMTDTKDTDKEEKCVPEIAEIDKKETDDMCLPKIHVAIEKEEKYLQEINGDESCFQAQNPLQLKGPYVARILAPKQLDLQQILPQIKILNISKIGEKLVLTGHSEDKYKLIVMNIHDNTHFSLSLHSFKIPWKLTEIDQRGIDMIALSYVESNVIDILNISTGKLERKIEIPDKCRALAPYRSNLCVIVYKHILLVDHKGEIIKDTRLPSDDVDYMFVHKEQIIYTYIETLYCCDFEGELLWKLKPEGIRFVSDLAVDGCGNSYVSGSSPYRVLVISADGTQQKTLLFEDTLVSIRFDSKMSCLLVFPSKDASIVRLYDVHVRSFQ